MPLAARRAARRSVVGPAPVSRTATTVATAAVVAHGINRRIARREVHRDDGHERHPTGYPDTHDERTEP
jgi:hypothetical protein